MDPRFSDRSRWLAENDLAFVLDQRNPYGVSPGHCLVIPKRHVETVLDMTAAEWAAVTKLVASMCGRIQAELHPDGFNIGANCGAAAGQTVMHAHIHIIPRFAGDHPDPRGGVRAVIPGRAVWRD